MGHVRNWRVRKPTTEIHHEHTREVRETLSPEALEIIQRMMDSVMGEVRVLQSELAAQKAMLDAVREAQMSHSLEIIQHLREAMDRGAEALDSKAA